MQFTSNYDSRVAICERKLFIRLATGLQFYKFGLKFFNTFKKQHILSFGEIQSCFTGDQPYSNPSPYGKCSRSRPIHLSSLQPGSILGNAKLGD